MIDLPIFAIFVRDLLVPSLPPDQRVLWDNLHAHWGETVRSLIEAVGGTLHFLPPYSLNLNPIEPGSSKLKTLRG